MRDFRLPSAALTVFLAAIAGAQPALAQSVPSPFAAAVAPATQTAAITAITPAQAAPEAATLTPLPSSFNPAGLPFSVGMYQCELNRKVHVRSITADLQSAVLNWDHKDYTVRAVGTRTGALRYEDTASGLVWLVIIGKSMLLDTRRGQQLANECKT